MADHAMGSIALSALPIGAIAVMAALTNEVETATGFVAGAGSVGDGGSGIDLPEHERIGIELSRISSSAVASSFLQERLSSLKLTFPMAGARNTSDNPKVDANFNLLTHWPGVDSILLASGLSGAAWGGGVGHTYTVSSPAEACVGVWFGGLKVVYTQVYTTIAFKLTPGEAGLVEVTFSAGSVYSWGVQALTSILMGNQAIAPPVVKNVANAWSTTRPFTSLEITVNPNIKESPDSNAATGVRLSSEAVDVSFKTQIYSDNVTVDYERSQAILTSAPTADLVFTVPGAATVAGAVCNSYTVNLNNITPDKFKPVKIGTYLGWDVEGTANAITTAGTEFSLIFV